MKARTLIVPSVVTMAALMRANTCGPTGTSGSAGVRLALTLGAGVRAPVYVQVTSEDDQPGWVRLTRMGERIHLRERCEVPDCGRAPAVCGAAIPLVRDIGVNSGPRAIDVQWDGTMSVVDPAAACETREAAPAGDYVATFCYSRRADLADNATGGRDVQGVLLQPTCRAVSFSLPREGEVVVSIPNDSF